ncbi:hypothetical protein [Gracilibacillus phocaeensis]|uniref:hypothetical protein n=1 Tax=Gracilibacillus phocaeensis TaxID=2042304 RepID=UPI002570FD14|nr:hypothetical protein [Gracilibacillus phocaeensis]
MKRLAIFAFVAVLVACGSDDGSSGDATNITVLIGKNEIATQFETMVEDFNASHDDIDVETMPLGGQNAYERMTTLYSSGSAPTIMMMRFLPFMTDC